MGEVLSARLGMPCVDMDTAIARRAGMSIPEIVEKFGWSKFRDMESREARELSELDNVIMDTGGGVIERPGNMEVLRKNACTFWLKASVDTIVSRIQGGAERPALTSGKTFTEEVAEVLERRTPAYRIAAQHEIDTDGLAPEQVAERIIEIWIKKKQGRDAE